jgi:hypothetical protein
MIIIKIIQIYPDYLINHYSRISKNLINKNYKKEIIQYKVFLNINRVTLLSRILMSQIKFKNKINLRIFKNKNLSSKAKKIEISLIIVS